MRAAFEAMHRTVLATFGQDGLLDGVGLRLAMDHMWRPPDIGSVRTALIEPCCYVMMADSAGVHAGSLLQTQGRSYEVIRIERLEHHQMLKLILRPENTDGVALPEY